MHKFCACLVVCLSGSFALSGKIDIETNKFYVHGINYDLDDKTFLIYFKMSKLTNCKKPHGKFIHNFQCKYSLKKLSIVKLVRIQCFGKSRTLYFLPASCFNITGGIWGDTLSIVKLQTRCLHGRLSIWHERAAF